MESRCLIQMHCNCECICSLCKSAFLVCLLWGFCCFIHKGRRTPCAIYTPCTKQCCLASWGHSMQTVKTFVCLFSFKLWYKSFAIQKQELFSAENQLCKNVTKTSGPEEKTALLPKGTLGAVRNIYIGLKHIINTKQFSTNHAKGRTRN